MSTILYIIMASFGAIVAIYGSYKGYQSKKSNEPTEEPTGTRYVAKEHYNEVEENLQQELFGAEHLGESIPDDVDSLSNRTQHLIDSLRRD